MGGSGRHAHRADINLAGEEGFEPSHAGIKIRCLNQLGDSPRVQVAIKRVALQPPRDKSAHRGGQLAQHRLCALSLRRELCKHARPRSRHPRLRAPRAQPREVRRDLRAALHGHGFEIVPAQAGEKGRYFESFRITCQRVIAEHVGRGNAPRAAPARRTTLRQRQRAAGARRRPRRARSRPKTKTGTSAPRRAPSSSRRSRGQSRPHSRLSTMQRGRRIGGLPPPRPPPIGRRLSSARSAPSAAPLSACSSRAARRHRSSASATPAAGRAGGSAAVGAHAGCRRGRARRSAGTRSAAGDSRRRAGRPRAGTGSACRAPETSSSPRRDGEPQLEPGIAQAQARRAPGRVLLVLDRTSRAARARRAALRCRTWIARARRPPGRARTQSASPLSGRRKPSTSSVSVSASAAV